MSKINLKPLQIKARKEIKKARDLKELDGIFRKYLGKKGEITQILRSLKNLSAKERKKIGKLANQIKREIEKIIEKKRKEFQVSSFKFQEVWITLLN